MTTKRQEQSPGKPGPGEQGAGPREQDDWLIQNKPRGNALIEEFLQAYETYGPDDSWFIDLLPEVMKCFDRYDRHEAATLDKAFDARRPDNYRHGAARNRARNRRRVQSLGRRLRDAGAVTDKEFFAVLGEMTKVSGSQAEKWFYDSHLRLQPRRFTKLESIFERYRHKLSWFSPGESHDSP